jgi:hypothetical protein
MRCRRPPYSSVDDPVGDHSGGAGGDALTRGEILPLGGVIRPYIRIYIGVLKVNLARFLLDI